MFFNHFTLFQNILHEFVDNAIDKGTMDDDKMEMFIRNEPNIRRLFFGRKQAEEKSIFEKVFGGPFESNNKSWIIVPKLINYVWNIFELSDKPEILALVSLLILKII